jgi:ABC-type Fe3+-siderophore transport system permease subunit
VRGAIIGGVSGPLLGSLAATMMHGSVLHGVLRGISVALVGAIAGGVIGLLRAQPTSLGVSGSGPQAGQILSPANLLKNALEGAGKGAFIGAALGAGLVIQHFFGGPFEVPIEPRQALTLFGIAGAIGGALVGVIQAMPRDRRQPPAKNTKNSQRSEP